MHIEHFALNVPDPRAMASWYCTHCGMSVARAVNAPPHTHFLADHVGRVLVEIYCNPPDRVPEYAARHPLDFHFAFHVDDVRAERDRLLAAGATAAGEIDATPVGDQLAMLRDPWGIPIQLVNRGTPMLPI
jgi:glyoxylase I family protein